MAKKKKEIIPIKEKIIDVEYSEEMEKSYLGYALEVIGQRAIPDIRDGLKPVQRRTLYAMNNMGIYWDKNYKKCGRIVGDCMGRYHPHGKIDWENCMNMV